MRKGKKIRGAPKLSLQLQPRSKNAQVIAYLYDINKKGVGTLITHSAYTLLDNKYREKIKLDFDLQAVAYDVPRGHKLAIAFDTRDPLYKNPMDFPYFLDFEFNGQGQSTLIVPTL